MLSEFIIQGYDLENLKPYEEFLIECSQNDYEDLITQTHHVLPKFMNGTDFKNNLIKLSIEDHFNAHLILGNCFPKGTDENRYNLSSAGKVFASATRLFRKFDIDYSKIDFWIDAHKLVKSLVSGENNSFFGKNHSPETKQYMSELAQARPGPNLGKKFSEETCKLISQHRKEYYKNNEHWNKGNHWSDDVKKKISDSEKGKVISEKQKQEASVRMMGNNFSIIRQYLIFGKLYNSIKIVAEEFKISETTVRSRCKSGRLKWKDWQFGDKVSKMTLEDSKDV